ncbi:18775_t:CDS:2 [Funneliformis geosporum]|nr:18775_t:CDS:2 [Funneliformis geosporum]
MIVLNNISNDNNLINWLHSNLMSFKDWIVMLLLAFRDLDFNFKAHLYYEDTVKVGSTFLYAKLNQLFYRKIIPTIHPKDLMYYE